MFSFSGYLLKGVGHTHLPVGPTQRSLYLPNVEELSTDRLEEIYRSFVVPKPQRARHRNIAHPGVSASAMDLLAQRIQEASMLGHKRANDGGGDTSSSSPVKQIKIGADPS
ncbi:hypothetical protein KR018_002999 [Drosophila ironensis]|nr:hypothetical protein KR018_002999 [Drosophila ironensis]